MPKKAPSRSLKNFYKKKRRRKASLERKPKMEPAFTDSVFGGIRVSIARMSFPPRCGKIMLLFACKQGGRRRGEHESPRGALVLPVIAAAPPRRDSERKTSEDRSAVLLYNAEKGARVHGSPFRRDSSLDRTNEFSLEKRLCRFSGKQEVFERSCGTNSCLLGSVTPGRTA